MPASTSTTVAESAFDKQRLSIPDRLLPGLDPEWVKLWETHGSFMVRADERTIEEYRASPADYSFSYATCPGGCCRGQCFVGIYTKFTL